MAAQPVAVQPVTVAVIDSGVRGDVRELEGRVLPGYDLVENPGNGRAGHLTVIMPEPPVGRCDVATETIDFTLHGTEVARILVANSPANAESGYAGVAILPVRVFNGCRVARRDLADALAWAGGLAVDGMPENPWPAKIINLSLAGGSRQCGADLQGVIRKLADRDILVVVAAGNNFHRALIEPANCDGVIVVGAVDADNRIAKYSAIDPRIDVYAFGGECRVLANQPDPKTSNYSLSGLGKAPAGSRRMCAGTSFAAPVVAGLLARWTAQNPRLQLREVKAALAKNRWLFSARPECPFCTPAAPAKSLGADARAAPDPLALPVRTE